MAYVYVIEVDDVVRYVGKGSRETDRFNYHFYVATNLDRQSRLRSIKLYNKLAAAFERDARILGYRVKDGLSDDAAYRLEAEMIVSAPPGQLWNVSSGNECHHHEIAKLAWSRPGYREVHRERIRLGLKAAVKRSEGMQRGLQAGRDAWRDPERSAARGRAVSAAKKGMTQHPNSLEGTKSAWADPEKRRARCDKMREAWVRRKARAY